MATSTRSPGSDKADGGTRAVGSSRMRRRRQLSDEVAAHLRSAIMSGELRSGDSIRLDETAVELGVSVTPVREALLTLRGEGMVESAPNRGYRVSPMGIDDIGDIFWLQSRIAVELAQRAFDRAEPADLDRLAEFNDRLRTLVSVPHGTTPDVERIADAEYDFHRELNLIAGSPKLAWFLNIAARVLPYRLYAQDPGWGVQAVNSHDRLVRAMRSGDRDEVIAQTLAQFDDASARLLEYRERVESGEYPF